MKRGFISRAIVLVFVMAIGLSSQTFSRQFQTSLGNALSTTNLGAKDVSQVFGKGKSSNIYSTALTLVKNNEVKTTFSSIDAIMNIHPEFFACNITADDVLNVLYDSHLTFRSTLELTVINKSKKKVSVPSESNIVSSYKRFLLCRKGQTDFINISDSQDVSNMLKKEYGEPLASNFNQGSMKEVNFGDDIYLNGTLDDSDYDLLVDMDKIGQKFFESFTHPMQTLFYELPTLGSLGGGNGGGNQGSQPGGNFSVLPGGQGGSAPGSAPGSSTGGLGGFPPAGGALKDPLADIDPGVKDFINGNNNQTFPPSDLYDLPPGQCVTGIASEVVASGAVTLTVDEYEDFIQDSIDAISANPSLDASPKIPAPAGTVTGGTSSITPPGSPNEWAEEAVNSLGGDCGETCNGLTEGEQLLCLNSCLEQCTAKCDGLPAYDKLYCESQCLCRTIGGPIGENWKGMENMYQIKFCTIPVQNNRVTGGKKVFSIEEIFKEIKNVFDSLLNGGEIIKRTRPKEYFDTSLSEIKFQDIFSFQIVTQVKPLYPTISKSDQGLALKRSNDSYESAVLGMTPDDRNKYVIVADVIGNKVATLHIDDLDAYNTKVEELKKRETESKQTIKNLISNASISTVAGLNDNVLNFLQSNLNFRNNVSQILGEINGLANLLKINIDSDPKTKK